MHVTLLLIQRGHKTQPHFKGFINVKGQFAPVLVISVSLFNSTYEPFQFTP